MNEFDDLFDEKPKQELITEKTSVESFYQDVKHQEKNGILLMIYIGILVIFSFMNELIVNARYPDVDAIIDSITLVENPAITVEDNDDVDNPYNLILSGIMRNDSEYNLPVLWVDIEFFDEESESYGIYTFSEDDVIVGETVTIDETMAVNFNPASYEITYGFDEGTMFYIILGILPVMLSAIAFLFVDKLSFKNDWQRFKKDFKGHFGQILSGFFLVYATLFASQLILNFIGVTGTSQNEMSIQGLFSTDPIQLVLLFFLLCIFTPITEEVIFRKVIYNFIEPKGGRILAIIFTGVIFGIMHVLSYGDFIQAIPYVLMGITFGYIYYRSKKNILVTIGVHFANNLLSVIIYILIVYGIYTI